MNHMSIKNKYYSNGFFTKKYYPNGQLAIFFHTKDGEPIAELSVNEDTVELDSNEIILKDYSENSQIAQEFINSQIFIPTDRFVLIGTHLCPICEVAI